MANEVKDNVARHRFEIERAGHAAFATYRRVGDIVTILHTEVPTALEGQGIGSALVKGALELLRAKGEKVSPQCPFFAAYIRKHPTFGDLLAEPLRDAKHIKTDAMLDEALEETFPASDSMAVTPRQ